MLIVIMATALAFNVLIIYWKFTHQRIFDGILDTSALILLATVFGGSSQSLMVATIASAIISIYFLRVRPTLPSLDQAVPSKPEFQFKKQTDFKKVKLPSVAVDFS